MTDDHRSDDDRADATRRDDDTTPDPDHPAKPQTPTDLKKPSWKFALKRSVAEFSDDQCTDLAAALTYYAVLSLFPAIIAMVSLLGVFGQGKSTTDALLGIVKDLGGGSITSAVQGPIQQLTESKAAGFGLVFGILGALWSASGYVGAFGRALNRVYEIGEGRPFWKLRPLQIVITLFAVILISLVALSLVVTGPLASAIGNAIGLGSTAVTVWNIAKWPVMILVVVVIIAVLYYATPNVKQPKFRWMSIGAFTALVTWLVASALFGLYVANFSSYGKTYGSLAGVIVFLLWLWITNLALLFGAEVDSELERSRELQAGMRAEDELQLPARDDSKLVKKEEKENKAREEARRLRESGR
jgi:membrane protein